MAKKKIMPREAHKLLVSIYFLHIACFLPSHVSIKYFWFWSGSDNLHIDSYWMYLCFVCQPYKISFRKSLGKKGNGNAWASYWILLTSLFGTEPQVQQCSQITACCFGSIKSLSQAENMSKQIAAVSLRLKHEHEVKKKKKGCRRNTKHMSLIQIELLLRKKKILSVILCYELLLL